MKRNPFSLLTLCRFLVPLALAAGISTGFSPQAATVPPESELLARLTAPDTAKADKAITCKYLAIHGTARSVPALAELLTDPELSSWARIALEVIPGSEADTALREAVPRVQGRLRVGVINSIGVRRDSEAVPLLVDQLGNADAEVAAAAAVALGHIGGRQAVRTLLAHLSEPRPYVRSAVAQGCVLAAENLLKQHRNRRAAAVYDAVRAADVPVQRRLEAIRGAILARGEAGLELLLQQIRSDDPVYQGIGLRTARQLPGQAVTEALEAEMHKTSPRKAALILLAIADRKDDAVRPAVLRAAGPRNPGPVRLEAVQALEHLGGGDAVPVLLQAAAAEDRELAAAGRQTLTRLSGPGVEAALLRELKAQEGIRKEVLLEVVGLRVMHDALPEVVQAIDATDAQIRTAALKSLAILGGAKEVELLVNRISTAGDASRREQYAETLLVLAGRVGRPAASALLSLVRASEPALRIIGVHALATVGGPEAAQAAIALLDDPDPEVQDEVVRTLSTWPGNWPDDTAVGPVLQRLAREGRKPAHQVLGFRGYLEHLRVAPGLTPDERVERVLQALEQAKRPEENKPPSPPSARSPPAKPSKRFLPGRAKANPPRPRGRPC